MKFVVTALICAAASRAEPAASIEGRVVNAITGEPVRKVSLTLGPADGKGTPHSATSAIDGHFRMEGLEPGRYRLGAQKAGFVQQAYGAKSRNPWEGTAIAIAEGQQLKDVEFKLMPQSVVTGKVVDEDGDPVQNVQVTLLRMGFIDGRRQMVQTGGETTNDLGEFRLANVSAGRYFLRAQWEGQNLNFPKQEKGREEAFSSTYYPGSTDPSGAAPIEVRTGEPVSGMDIRLRKAAVYHVRGKVAGASASARVMLVSQSEGGPGVQSNDMVKPDQTFDLAGVLPGEYSLVAAAADGRQRNSARVPVTVGNRDLDGVTVTLTAGTEIRGVVRVAGTEHPAVQGIRVMLMQADTSRYKTSAAMVNEDGTFSMQNVGRDRYRVTVYVSGAPLYLKSVKLGDREVLESGIDWSQGASGALEITLSSAGGAIDGVVQNENGEAVPGARVILVPETPKPERTALYKAVNADQNGQFSLKSLAPGDYRVMAPSDIEAGEELDPEFIKNYGDKSVKVKVQENSRQRIQVQEGSR